MNFPLEAESQETAVASKIMPLKDSRDGRVNVRGWVRTYSETNDPVYIAAYSSHVNDEQRYMNIAFPLPAGNLTSILRLIELPFAYGNGVLLTSFSDVQKQGNQGVYFVILNFGIRLPINETIDVFASAADCEDTPPKMPHVNSETLFARHRMWLFGFPFLTLFYSIGLKEIVNSADNSNLA